MSSRLACNTVQQLLWSTHPLPCAQLYACIQEQHAHDLQDSYTAAAGRCSCRFCCTISCILLVTALLCAAQAKSAALHTSLLNPGSCSWGPAMLRFLSFIQKLGR